MYPDVYHFLDKKKKEKKRKKMYKTSENTYVNRYSKQKKEKNAMNAHHLASLAQQGTRYLKELQDNDAPRNIKNCSLFFIPLMYRLQVVEIHVENTDCEKLGSVHSLYVAFIGNTSYK